MDLVSHISLGGRNDLRAAPVDRDVRAILSPGDLLTRRLFVDLLRTQSTICRCS